MTKQTAKKQRQKETKKPEVKPEYYYVEPCSSCGQHGWVHFMNTKPVPVTSDETTDRLCQAMGDEMARRFRFDVARYQAEGKLMHLASPEVRAKLEKDQADKKLQEEKAREAVFQELNKRSAALRERADKLEMAKLNNRALTKPVTDILEKALLDRPDMKRFFEEMSARDWFITINVGHPYSNNSQEIHIYPNDLINQDVDEEAAELNQARQALENDRRKVGY